MADKERNNLSVHLLGKIRRFSSGLGEDEKISGLVEVADISVVAAMRDRGVILKEAVGKIYAFKDVSLSKIAEICDMDGVLRVEESIQLDPCSSCEKDCERRS